MKTEFRILIADDHPMFRQGLRQTVESEPGFQVVQEVGDGQPLWDFTRDQLRSHTRARKIE